MVHALLICSEGECPDVYRAYGWLEEIETLACECGCGLAIVAWPDSAEEVGRWGETVELVALAA